MILACLLTTLVIASSLTFAVGEAGASSHPNYPLGKAKSCKSHYVKRTERHLVIGKEVQYVACVYLAPSSTTTTSTTTTTPAIPQYSVELASMSPIADGLPVGQDDVFAALVTDPDSPTVVPSGTVTFTSNGASISSCQEEALVPNEFNGSSPSFTDLSSATCTLAFPTAGLFTLTATVTESDGATDVGTLGVYIVP